MHVIHSGVNEAIELSLHTSLAAAARSENLMTFQVRFVTLLKIPGIFAAAAAAAVAAINCFARDIVILTKPMTLCSTLFAKSCCGVCTLTVAIIILLSLLIQTVLYMRV